MLNIKQFLYSKDNFAYIIYSENEAVAIDPGCPNEILSFLNKENLTLKQILNTHTHHDHICGNSELHNKTEIKPLKFKDLMDRKFIYVEKECVEIISTPGHTMDSVCFKTDDFIVTGDTLFIANIGNCFTGKFSIYRESLDKVLALPDTLIVYPGHDYTERSIKRAKGIETKNEYIVDFWKKYNPPPVVSSIGWEKKINPYLRAHKKEVKRHLADNDKCVKTEFDCFKSFMKMY